MDFFNISISEILTQFGFPAAVCFYLMARVVKSVDKNTTAIDALREEIMKLVNK